MTVNNNFIRWTYKPHMRPVSWILQLHSRISLLYYDLAYSCDVQTCKLRQNIPFVSSLIILYNNETVCMSKKSLRLKIFYYENTALLGYYAVDGEFSIVWRQPIGLMLMDGKKCSRPATEGENSNRCSTAQHRKSLHTRRGRTDKRRKCNIWRNG